MRLIRYFLIALCILTILYGAAAWYFSGVLVAFPVRPLEEDRKNLDIEGPWEFDLPAPEALDVRHEGLRLRGWLFRNENGRGDCGVVASHGHTGTRYGGLKYARLFYERGCHASVLDARHHGESDGAFGTYGYFEKHDLAAFTREFAKRTDLPLKRVGLIGESMGGAISLQAAPLLEDLAFVAADSPYANAKRIFTKQAVELYGPGLRLLTPAAFFFAEFRSGADLDAVVPAAAAERIQSPVLLIHSASDALIPAQHSREIFAAVPHDRKRLAITEWGAIHGQSVDTNLPEYRRFLNAFLDDFVPGF